MNLHMPQDPESEAELKNLAAVPYHIISPANNSSIIGIYQDSMLGSYLFSKEGVKFSNRQAMNLLMMFDGINEGQLLKDAESEGGITNYDILTQIMPPLSIKNKIEIKNGKYIHGQMDKGVLGGRSKGLLQRICNEFGNMASAKFIDDLQNIVTEYMKSAGFSVGISDLISNQTTNDEIINVITNKKTEVKNLIDQIQMGVFENNTGKSNEELFETQVNSILNQATSESGKIGLKNLSENNRFVQMVKAGSKGSELNISFMISCLGQQNVDGKRIPYGFEHRTLPHYPKYDDSPGARGFVESSYINGLTPQELFMHAMGGRVGLIDTAVKTSTTGYIQRKLIKGLEDLMVNYDMTIRTNKNKIVQFQYGDDGIDTIKVEGQELALVEMGIQDIYNHYLIPEETGKNKTLSNIFMKSTMSRYKKQHKQFVLKMNDLINKMIEMRPVIIQNVFNNKNEKTVNCSVSFNYIINTIQGQCGITTSTLVDITPLEAFEMIQFYYDKLNQIYYSAPTELFKTLYFYYLSPKELLTIKRFNKNALTLLLDTIILDYKKSIVSPGEMVGIIAGQSIGEVSTQMSVSYDTKHKLLIKNKQTGDVNFTSIIVGNFIDELMKQYPQYTFDTGYENSYETLLDNLDSEYYIQSVDEKETTKWTKLSHVSKHPVNGQMIRVYTKSGRMVETTPSHSHLIRNQHKVTAITGFKLTEGMRIPVCKSIQNAYTKEYMTFHIHNNEVRIPLGTEFGWFVGAYLAEGNLNYNEISITNISDIYIQKVKLVANMFGCECRIAKTQGQYGPSVTTKFVCSELAQLLRNTCGNGSYDKRIPDFAFIAPNDFKTALFQGYFDGDGNFQCDEQHHQLRCCSRSKQLIKDLALLLNYFEIFATMKTEVKHGKPLYHLNIPPKYAVTYQQTIDTLLHKQKLDNLVKYITRHDAKYLSEQIDKIEGFGEIIAHCGKTLKLPGQSRTYGFWRKQSTIGRRTLEKYYNVFSQHPQSHLVTEELKLIDQVLTANVIWDEIVNIEYYTPDQNEYVYDFTVPGTQTFMTDYGVFVHNTLNTFHFAGVASKSNVTRGVPRIDEILSLSGDIKNPSLTIYLKPEDERQKEKAQTIMYMLERTCLEEIVKTSEICFDPNDLNTLIDEDKECIEQYKAFENMVSECNENTLETDKNEKSKWVVRMVMDPEVMLEKNITMDDVNFTLKSCYEDQINCIYSDFNSDKLVFRIRMNNVLNSKNNKAQKNQNSPLDQSDEIYVLKNFQDHLLKKIVLRGVEGINKVILRKEIDNVFEINGIYKNQDIWVLDSVGTNLLDVLGLDYIDNTRTFGNDIIEIYNVLGIEAARQTIYNEFVEVVEFDGTYINYHNYSVLVDRMTFTHKLISIFRHGINNDNIGPIAKASFEETPEMFLKAARHAELDTLRGISANIMCGQEGYFGTSSFQVVLDMEEMQKIKSTSEYQYIDADEEIDKFFGDAEALDDVCGPNKIAIQNNVVTIQAENMGNDNSYDPGF